jgi:hypothetical protein
MCSCGTILLILLTTSQVNNLLGSPLISASKVYPAGRVAGAVTWTNKGSSFLTCLYGVSDVITKVYELRLLFLFLFYGSIESLIYTENIIFIELIRVKPLIECLSYLYSVILKLYNKIVYKYKYQVERRIITALAIQVHQEILQYNL